VEALKRMITQTAEVLRDKERRKINAHDLVPGDVVFLHQGTKVPADGVLIQANRLYINEALLTGESVPVIKKAAENTEKKNRQEHHFSWMGTIVSSGKGIMIVEETGARTKMGEIALEIQEPKEDTPLQKQLVSFSKGLVYLILGLTLAVFVVGIISQRELVEMFTTSVALAVSAIPEGLLVGLTVVLAIGMHRILKRKGLVRKLTSAETLGGVTTICLDKTGTLTKGHLEVTDIVGDKTRIAKQMLIANDLDDPIVIAAHQWALEVKEVKEDVEEYERIDSIPFSAKERFFASLNPWKKDKNMLFVNGAPDYILEWTDLDKNDKQDVKREIEKLTGEGKRLVGLARKEVSESVKKINTKQVKSGLSWIGMIAFSDPVREGVKVSLAKARRAGIDLKVITGDYPKTAAAVMKELDLDLEDDQIITGQELGGMSDVKLANKVKSIKLFARTTPDQKLRIVEALKQKGEVVAMMGDGVNDAPALNIADIGIVVGDATDVAKESADLILLDSHFDTVVAAIEEGRVIFENIRKIVIYLMSSSFNAITAVMGSIVLGLLTSTVLPLPVSAAQILWINLVTNGFPDLALTVDPKRPGLMSEAPRSPREPLVTGWMKVLIGIISLTSGIFALALFYYVYRTTGDVVLSQSVAFVALGFNTLVYVFSARTLKEPFWKEGFFDNKWLIAAVFAGLVLQLFPFMFETSRQFFGTTLFSFEYWVYIVITSLVTFLIVEVLKVFFRRSLD
jgi:P-type Ca2+ transporter type 2C